MIDVKEPRATKPIWLSPAQRSIVHDEQQFGVTCQLPNEALQRISLGREGGLEPKYCHSIMTFQNVMDAERDVATPSCGRGLEKRVLGL